ncbi:MAG: hypothetical protein RSD67_02465 [Oscillospiraceae bacterium]
MANTKATTAKVEKEINKKGDIKIVDTKATAEKVEKELNTNINLEAEIIKERAEKEKLSKDYSEMEERMKQMEEAFAKLQATQQLQPQITIAQPVGNNNKTIPVYSLVPNTYVLYPNENATGARVVFPKFGHVERIRYTDLIDILRIHKQQFMDGLAYIADTEFVKNECPEIDYSKIYSVEQIEQVVALNDELSVDMILSLSAEMQENVTVMIARKINEGFNYNYNYIKKLEENGLKISKMVEGIKITDNMTAE